MAAHFARGDRRRRVLHDETRTAIAIQVNSAAPVDAGGEAPRYGEMASVEHHPQITDYVPRRKRAVLVTIAAGATVAVVSQALTLGASVISAALPVLSSNAIVERIAGGMVAWSSAIALLAISGLARLVYSLRRHRVDDVRGRYRVWTWMTWGALALSLNAVVGVHELAASILATATGWTLTAGGAEWWIIPAALGGAWIGTRVTLEIAESRSALAITIVAACCYGLAAAGSLGWSPNWLGPWSGALADVAPLVGHAWALAAMMVFARYVVLDVQGLIDHSPRPQAKASASAPAGDQKSPGAAQAMLPAARRDSQPAPAARWDEPSEDEDADADQGGQYLSKSERKRLRKQQQRRAA